MVLLFDIPLDDLKNIPTSLWNKPIDSSNPSGFLFNVIGSVTSFNEEKVYLSLFSFNK